MLKKVLGGLFCVVAALVLLTAIVNGSRIIESATAAVPYYRSSAAAFGALLGMILPVVMYALSGIFLLRFDRGCKLDRMAGWKLRKRQCVESIVFAVAYVYLWVATGIAGGKAPCFGLALHELPYSIPCVIFVVVWAYYALPFGASKKHFIKNKEDLKHYLAAEETFVPCAGDGAILTSEKALYFPKLFCVVPFDQIESIKPYQQLWEKGVYFHLTNGKKFSLATKYAAEIQMAIDSQK